VGDRPNSDIKEIKAEIEGEKITLSMTLWPGGTFSRGQYGYASYIMFYNTSDAWYSLTYGDLTGEEPGGIAMGYSLAGYNPPMTTGEVAVNGNTISATMDKVGEDTTSTELYGLSWVWEGYGAEQYELDHWHDWVGDYEWNPEFEPEEDNGEENDEEDDEDDGSGLVDDSGESDGNGKTSETNTPGFEIFTVISALVIAFIILRRRK
jgi:hypothetical protein